MQTDMDMLETARRTLQQYGVPAEFGTTGPAPTGEPAPRLDARIRLRIGADWRQFDVQCHKWLRPGNLGGIAAQLRPGEHPGLLVADHITRPMAERLRELGISFVDMAGNAWLEVPPVVLRIEGRKPERRAEEPPRNRAFQRTGLKVVFTLLCRPALFRAPLRDVAAAAGVAHQSVAWVMRGLAEQGYLVEQGKGRGRRRIPRRILRLLDDWAAEYARNLRPALLLGRYAPGPRTPADWWRQADLRHHGILLGGEPAAAQLTGYLQPGTITLYAEQVPGRVIVANRLEKDEERGTIEIRQRFWPFEHEWHRPDLTPPTLIYADLLATDASRCVETARMIHEQYLAAPLSAH